MRARPAPGLMPRAGAMLAAIAMAAGCLQRPVDDPDVIVVGITSSPNDLDPRYGLDDSSQKLHQLIYDSLVALDDRLRFVTEGALAETLDNPDPLTWRVTLRRGIRFHDGHELTSADVAHTFRSLVDPAAASPRGGALRGLAAVEETGRYAVVFRLRQPFPSFPADLHAVQVVPAGAGRELAERPIGTGPYRFVRHVADDRVELAPFGQYWRGAPRNAGLVFRVVPDEVMRGLELRKGTMDVVINDLSPDIYMQLARDPQLQTATGPGVDYQYIGLNFRDPALSDRRVRQAIAHAIDRQAIVDHLRRGLATPADGLIAPLAWAHADDLPAHPHDSERARALLDAAGYADPDGRGPRPRLRLTLKTSNVEFNRLQAAVVQQDLARVGIALDVRTYEFATLFSDVTSGNFQLYFLQWTGGALADPDILRRVFHSSQTPPAGYNRGRFKDPEIDALLDRAAVATDPVDRYERVAAAQRAIARELPYISLWHKTNFAIARRTLTGIRLSPVADFLFLQHVVRTDAVPGD